jgi:hypothetical protein
MDHQSTSPGDLLPRNRSGYYENSKAQDGQKEDFSRRETHSGADCAQAARGGCRVLAAGASVLEVARKLSISEATFHRSRNQ